MNSIVCRVLLAVNVVAIALLLLCGYSGYISPAEHQHWAMAGFAFPAALVGNVAFVVVWAFVRKRYLLVPIIGLMMAYWPIRTYVPLNSSGEVPKGALKVLSYNVFGLNLKDAPEGEPNPIFKYVLDSKADIVCMQEYSVACQTDSLWPQCEKLYPYRDTLMSTGPKGGNYIAVFSKYPILSKEHIPIQTDNNCAGAFMLDVKGRRVCVINLHLETVGLSAVEKEGFSDMVHGRTERDSMERESRNLISKISQSSVVRSRQADVVNDFIRRKLAESRSRTNGGQVDGGIILCGDFNDHPLSYVHQRIADKLTDCYTEAGRGVGYTMHYNSMYFRIDNIMCSSNWQPYQCTVDKSIALSDHYPIYCYLTLKKEQ